MSWKDRAANLLRRCGASARPAARLALLALAPGAPALADLIDRALAQAQGEAGCPADLGASPADLKQADRVLALLGQQLRGVLAELSGGADPCPVVDRALASEAQPRLALAALADVAGALEVLDSESRRVLGGLGLPPEVVEGLLPVGRRLATVAAFVEESLAQGEPGSPEHDLTARLDPVRRLAAAFAAGDLAEADRWADALPETPAGLEARAVVLAVRDPAAARAALNRALQTYPGHAALAGLQRRVTVVMQCGGAGSLAGGGQGGPGPGDTVGGWRLEEALGAGKRVFRARKGRLSAAVTVWPSAGDDLAGRARFRREVETLVALPPHPALARLLDGGQDVTGLQFLAAELVPGTPLEEHLGQAGPLRHDLPRARDLFVALADGLARVHAAGVVHRAIRPASVVLRVDRSPVLVGFGPPPRADPDPAFAAPELRRGREVDARGEVFALGALLLHALLHDRADRRGPDQFRPDEVPGPLRSLLACALDPEAGQRHRDAAEFRDALRRVALPQPVAGPAALGLTVPGRWFSRPVGLAPGGEWAFGTEAPARIRPDPDAEYRLAVTATAADADLAGLPALARGVALVELSLAGCVGLTEAGFRLLRDLTRLRALDLAGCLGLGDAALTFLRGLAGLGRLDLSGCARVTARGTIHLAALPALRSLRLTGCTGLGDDALADLRDLAGRLEALALPPGLTDDGLRALVGLRGLAALRDLDLTGCARVGDAGLARLQALAGLERLDLRGCRALTDRGVAAVLPALTRLRVLALPPGAGDAALGRLTLLPDLEELDLRGGPAVSLRALTSLRLARPGCRVST